MNRWRLPARLTLIVGIPILCVLAVVLVSYWELGELNYRVSHLVAATAKSADLGAEVRTNLQWARRLPVLALMTTDDKEIREYVKQSRDWTKRVEDAQHALADLIDASPTSADGKLLDQFNTQWVEYRQSQEDALRWAADNTTLKAGKLVSGPLDARVRAVDDAAGTWLRQLDRTLAESQASSDVQRLRVLAKTHSGICRLQVIALDWHHQFNQLLLAASDEELNRLESRVAIQLKEAEAKLAELAVQTDAQEATRLEALGEAFGALPPLVAQLQKLLRGSAQGRSWELVRASAQHSDACLATMVEIGDHLDLQLKAEMAGIRDRSRYSQGLVLLTPLLGISLTVVLAASLARRIVREIRGLSQGIDGSADELSTVSHQLLSQSEQMTTQAGHVAGGTEQTATNINTMAASTEEMSMNVASISSASEEISVNVDTISSAAEATARNVTAVAGTIQQSTQAFEAMARDARDGSQLANRATSMADGAGQTMQDLERAAGEIGQVTAAIKLLALQTNLLALNATIEATTAGEAGKGFAVVAHEIKELAHQSAEAAEGIARKIEGVQSSTRDAVEVIREVQAIIRTLNTSSMRTSEAVESQCLSAQTSAGNLTEASRGVEHIARSIAEVAKGANDMSRNAAEAATGATDVSRNASEAAQAVRDISANIHGISQATRDNTSSAQQVNTAAERLTSIARQLQQLVG